MADPTISRRDGLVMWRKALGGSMAHFSSGTSFQKSGPFQHPSRSSSEADAIFWREERQPRRV